MTFEAYQDKVRNMGLYFHTGEDTIYITLGLCGEAGELANQIKKIYRDDNGVLGPYRVENIIGEMGDTLWYLTALCNKLGLELSDLADLNLKKLAKRDAAGTIQGDGDKR